ncbi:MAG: DUF5597 domain-containing protein [Terracidiphilus sp.]
MKMTVTFALSLIVCGAALTLSAAAQTDNGVPYLRLQGTATQLIVDGKPFLALAGELTNNAATSLPLMEPIWPKLVAGNLNTVLVGISWAQFEPEEGHFNYTQVDGVIAKARENNLHIIFLWFGSWKNGTSSFAPYWVKKDYTRFPRIQIGNGRTVSISGPLELLSTFSDATRDADAAAFAALMRHIKGVDGAQHTVVMMQVENEVGVLRDSRDRSPAANGAFGGPVPAELMSYLEAHRDTLIPEFRSVWAANGYKSAGTWEEVFGPGKPADVEIPIQTTSPPMSADEHEVSWRQLRWPSDEIFTAWNYARYVEKVVQAGKASYNVPMYVNAWLQQPNHAWPGTYPSGGPLPQVHDIWRAGAPDVDILAPDLYLPYFDEVCERFSRNGNPLFIPETGTDAANVIMAVGKFNTIGFSPFGVDGGRPIPPDLAATYEILNNMAPMILAHQGTGTMTAVRMVQGDPPKQVKLGDYTLTFTYTGRITRLAPQAKGGVVASPPPPRQPGAQPEEPMPPLEGAAVAISTGPNEYYFGGGGVRVDFTPNTPGPPNVGLGIVQTGRFVDGKWEITRWIEGDDDAQGEILVLNPGTIERVLLYRSP